MMMMLIKALTVYGLLEFVHERVNLFFELISLELLLKLPLPTKEEERDIYPWKSAPYGLLYLYQEEPEPVQEEHNVTADDHNEHRQLRTLIKLDYISF
jgi:hypothetical protein